MRSRTFRMLPAMILMTVLVFAVVFIGSMKTAEAALVVHSPSNGDRIPVRDDATTTVVILLSPTVYQYMQLPGQAVAVQWYVRMRVTCNGERLYYSSFPFKSVGRIEIELPVKKTGTYRLDFIEDRPVKEQTATGFTITWPYYEEEAFLKAQPDVSITFTAYHAEHTPEKGYTIDKKPTCTQKGSRSIHCKICGEPIPETVESIPATKHNWKISYKWSEDYSTVTAKAVCRNDSSHHEEEVAKAKKTGNKMVATFKNKIFEKQEKTITPVIKIKLNKTSAELLITAKKKTTLQLKASITPTNATNKDVVWKSSNTKVATVDKKGKVTVLKTGSVTITCTAADGSKVKATCKIVIKNTLVKKITLNKKNATLKQGNILQLKVKSILPKDAVNRNVKWKSSNKKVAVVDKDGRVTARGKGTCVITCTAADGSKIIAKCKITVK